jgi:hypothetical protein
MRRYRWLLPIPGFSAPTYAQPIALQITSLTGNVSIRAADDAPWVRGNGRHGDGEGEGNIHSGWTKSHG